MSITFLTYAFLTKSSKSPASIAKSKRASERLLESSTKYLEEKLKLTVNREKLNEILTGYLHYYGITDNSERITAFRYNVMKSYNFKYQGRSRSLIFKYSTSLKDILNRNSVMGSFKSVLLMNACKKWFIRNEPNIGVRPCVQLRVYSPVGGSPIK